MSAGDLYVNGTFHDDGEPVFVNDIEPEFVTCKSPTGPEVIVWQRKAAPGGAEFVVPGDYIWEVPAGVREIKLCMIGGGGGGSANNVGGVPNNQNGGGYAGAMYSEDIYEVTPGDIISVRVGVGGNHNIYASGGPGTESKFDGITVKGGAGGVWGGGYRGSGALRTHCRGSVKDGLKGGPDAFGNVYWGGQAGLGRGGSHSSTGQGTATSSGSEGIHGSGAAGGLRTSTPYKHGGDGAVFISWN